MAIILNDNIKINAGKPIDTKYLTTGNTVYVNTEDVTGATSPNYISVPERYTGLTVNILGEEYWFKEGVTGNDLVPKLVAGTAAEGTITGATNLGIFTGTTAIQQIRLATLSGFQPISGIRDDYDGDYFSVFNYYYRDVDGFIRVGISPIISTPVRAYVKTDAPVKSWIWSDRDDSTGTTEQVGWHFIDGNAELLVGEQVDVALYYSGATSPYDNDDWIEGGIYNVGDRKISISDVVGDLSSGTQVIAGGPVYAQNSLDGTKLELRTIRSLTPDAFTITYDDTFINISSVATKVITGGTNGLNVPTTGNINVIELGGALIKNTCISGADYNYSLSASSLNTIFLDASCGILSNSANSSPYVYANNYYSNALSTYSPYSIPDLKTVTGYTQNSALIKPICNITQNSYTVQEGDFYIGASGGSIITLPSTLPDGTIITVADVCGNAGSTAIQVGSNVGFFGPVASLNATIATDFGSMTYIYNCNKSRWGVLAFNPSLA